MFAAFELPSAEARDLGPFALRDQALIVQEEIWQGRLEN